jgi:hypothetical protein
MTMRIFSSAEYCLRAARQMSLTSLSKAVSVPTRPSTCVRPSRRLFKEMPFQWPRPRGLYGLTEKLPAARKSVFHFEVPCSVAKSTHADIPWLRFIRQRLGSGVHFWPIDGWDIQAGRSAIVEVYPALWSRGFRSEGRDPHRHDAYSIAAWVSRADQDGSLATFLNPTLAPGERAMTKAEGWILGVV